MKCHNCGMSLPDDSEFCQYCGEKVSAQMVQGESIVEEAFNNDSTTPHDENIGVTGGGRFLVDGPDGMPVWINADQLGKKQTANEEEVHKLKESIKTRLISDYQSQDYTEKTTLDCENNICPSCGQKLPKESEFCPYCGMSLATQREKTKVELFPESKEELNAVSESSITPERPQPAKSAIDSSQKPVSKESESLSSTVKNQNNRNKVTFKHCKKCGGIIDPKSRMCTDCRKQYFVPRYGMPIIILSVLLAVSLGISALLFYYLSDSKYEVEHLLGLVELKNDNITELRTKNEKQQKTISDQESTITELYEKIDDLKTENTSLHLSNTIYSIESEWFHDICDYLSSGTIGYAASNFCVDESVVLVHLDEGLHKTKLTAHWNNGGTIFFRTQGSCATIDYEDESWRTSTNLIIDPSYKGVMEVTFYNDVDDNDFKMIIIVVD